MNEKHTGDQDCVVCGQVVGPATTYMDERGPMHPGCASSVPFSHGTSTGTPEDRCVCGCEGTVIEDTGETVESLQSQLTAANERIAEQDDYIDVIFEQFHAQAIEAIEADERIAVALAVASQGDINIPGLGLVDKIEGYKDRLKYVVAALK